MFFAFNEWGNRKEEVSILIIIYPSWGVYFDEEMPERKHPCGGRLDNVRIWFGIA